MKLHQLNPDAANHWHKTTGSSRLGHQFVLLWDDRLPAALPIMAIWHWCEEDLLSFRAAVKLSKHIKETWEEYNG